MEKDTGLWDSHVGDPGAYTRTSSDKGVRSNNMVVDTAIDLSTLDTVNDTVSELYDSCHRCYSRVLVNKLGQFHCNKCGNGGSLSNNYR